ncbi:hypothetical protein KUCAC02_026910 [Chaenocephalus aceratus]|nr:hypothetical protein KUCAC02_026910 [Chaenocephalus aceratus]
MLGNSILGASKWMVSLKDKSCRWYEVLVKTGVSRKSGQVVQRKSSALNLHVARFLQDLTEFEWKTKN